MDSLYMDCCSIQSYGITKRVFCIITYPRNSVCHQSSCGYVYKMYMDQKCNMCVVKTSGNTTDIVCVCIVKCGKSKKCNRRREADQEMWRNTIEIKVNRAQHWFLVLSSALSQIISCLYFICSNITSIYRHIYIYMFESKHIIHT